MSEGRTVRGTSHHLWTALRLASFSAASLLLSAGIERPFLGMHSWRQCHNAMVARNFARHSWDPTLTLVDFGGGELLYGANAPLLTYPTGVLWHLLGTESPAIPRSLALLVTICTALLIEKLGREMCGRVYGLVAALLFLQIPLITGYGPAFFDDTVMLAAMVGVVLGAHRWGRRPGWTTAVATALALGAAVAVKPQAALVALPAVAAAAKGRPEGLRALLHPHLAAVVALSLAVGGLWYGMLAWRAHTWPDVLMAFSVAPGSDKWGNVDLFANPTTWILLSKRVTQEVCGLSGLLLAGLGVLCLRRAGSATVPLAWAAAVALHVLLVLGGHRAHDYYQLVLAPPAALLMAGAVLPLDALLDRRPSSTRHPIPGLFAVAAVALIAVMAVELHPFRHFLRTWEDERWEPIAEAVTRVTSPDEYVLVIDHSLPEILYVADRRGFHLTAEEATIEAIAKLEDRVAAVAVLEPGRLWDHSHPGLLYLMSGWVAVDHGDHHMVLLPSE